MSLIYDLFALSKTRSPYKTCHEIARALNKESQSPFFRRLKMLGKKEEGQELASLSQGTFIKYLLELISKKPDDDTRKIKREEPLEKNTKLPLRGYFIEENDAVIHKIILNYFSAVQDVFPEEWEQPDKYILSKSIGFGALVKAFPKIYQVGEERKDLSKDFFEFMFTQIREYMERNSIKITSNNYGSNEQARTKLTDDLLRGLGL